jgi:hypothetical protein
MSTWPTSLEGFANVWVADFEFRCPDGGLQEPRCLVARNWHSGETVRMWIGEGSPSPFLSGDLLVAFYASAEIGCFLSLGWDLPGHVLDLFAEFKNLLGGSPPLFGSGLLGACRYFGIQTATSSESKESNIGAAAGFQRGGAGASAGLLRSGCGLHFPAYGGNVAAY